MKATSSPKTDVPERLRNRTTGECYKLLTLLAWRDRTKHSSPQRCLHVNEAFAEFLEFGVFYTRSEWTRCPSCHTTKHRERKKKDRRAARNITICVDTKQRAA